jgi:uncharacterized sodium:solute symporter family permease YidK
VIAVVAVPVIAQQETGFYVLMKRLNATLTLPVVSVVIPAVLTQLTWRAGFVKAVMITASATYLLFDLGVRNLLADIAQFHWLHSVAIAFAIAVSLLLIFGRNAAGDAPQRKSEAIGWRFTAISCWTLLAGVVVLYAGLWWMAH